MVKRLKKEKKVYILCRSINVLIFFNFSQTVVSSSFMLTSEKFTYLLLLYENHLGFEYFNKFKDQDSNLKEHK